MPIVHACPAALAVHILPTRLQSQTHVLCQASSLHSVTYRPTYLYLPTYLPSTYLPLLTYPCAVLHLLTVLCLLCRAAPAAPNPTTFSQARYHFTFVWTYVSTYLPACLPVMMSCKCAGPACHVAPVCSTAHAFHALPALREIATEMHAERVVRYLPAILRRPSVLYQPAV